MLSAARIKNINRLHQKKFRKELGLFIAEGPKVVAEFLHSDIKITEIYGLEKWISANKALLNEKKCAFEVISEAELGRISGLQAPNEVFAVCNLPEAKHDVIDRNASLFLYLDGIADPGNMGTIIRMAEWYGLTQVFMSEASTEVYSPKVVQSSMGSVSRVKSYYLPLEKLTAITGKVEIWGAELKGENVYTASLPEKCILVIGSESHGIGAGTKKNLNKSISIPSAKVSKTESLNAAVATSVILSEIFRKSNFSE
ncbi:MAG: TrmH family RNA methyltransferase [Bacteroidia bacterium]